MANLKNILLSMFLIGISIIGIYSGNECDISGTVMVCKNGEFPKFILPKIRQLLLEHFNLTRLNEVHQRNVSMIQIQKLDIEADFGDSINSKSFEEFSNLLYLGIHGTQLRKIDKDAFHGLLSLLTLNLSSNPFLEIKFISGALNAENRVALPNLTSLIVSNVKTSVVQTVKLDKMFFESIASGRKLKYLDASFLNIAIIDFRDFGVLCKSLESLSMINSSVGLTEGFITAKRCTSLRKVYLSKIVITPLRLNFSFQLLNRSNCCELLKFFFQTESFMFDYVNKYFNVRQSDYFLNMSMCPIHLTKVSVAGNKIQWMNMTVELHDVTKRSLVELNVSHNGMEYLSPFVLMPSENIQTLDLSYNMLIVMQEGYTKEFEKLLWDQTQLRFIYLSHNSLTRIPKDTFTNNKVLEVLDISYNNINALDFQIKHLANLEKLILRYNNIHTIEQDIRMDLQGLLTKSVERNDTFNLEIEGNQLKCTCDNENIKFVIWVRSTKVIDENEILKCSLDGDMVVVRGNGRTDTEHFCMIQRIKKIAIISSSVVCTIVVISIITIVLTRRRRKRKLLIREVIAQIEMGMFPLPYLAFLSYCNEDTDLVMNNLYPQLCKHLSEMTHSDDELVCIGDKHFRPGFSLRDEVMRCIEDSSVFVAIVSRDFCRKPWCNLELGEAFEQNKPIIMVMVEHVGKELMDNFLQKIFDRYAHATWKADDNGGHMEPEWKIFCTSIIHLAGKWKEARRQVIVHGE